MSASLEERTRLEAERDFLLQSLDDLEAERAAGAIDEASYQGLHDDYTARAAAAIRALRDGLDTRPPRPTASWPRRVLVVGAIAVFAVGAGLALAAALGARLSGETSSGNTASESTERPGTSLVERRRRLEEAVARDPTDVGSRLLLATFLEADGDLAGALRLYDEVLEIDPQNADAYAHSGRLLYIAAGQAPDDAEALVAEARGRLDQAVAVAPDSPEPRYFRAIVLANEYGEFEAAQRDLQRYLVGAPNGRFVDDARALLARVTAALEPSTTRP